MLLDQNVKQNTEHNFPWKICDRIYTLFPIVWCK